MDWLKEAKDGYKESAYHDTAFSAAQVAALIAIAEAQRPRFVQIGPERINVDRIVRVEAYSTGSGPSFSNGINIWLDGAPCVQLKGAEMGVFLLWHDRYAEIERLSAEAEQ